MFSHHDSQGSLKKNEKDQGCGRSGPTPGNGISTPHDPDNFRLPTERQTRGRDANQFAGPQPFPHAALQGLGPERLRVDAVHSQGNLPIDHSAKPEGANRSKETLDCGIQQSTAS